MKIYHNAERYQLSPDAEDTTVIDGLELSRSEGVPDNGPLRTQNEVAEIMGLSRNLVDKLERRARQKLREALADLEEEI